MRLRDDTGITLVELVVASAISLILLAGLGGVFNAVEKAHAFGQTQSEALDTARLVLNQLQRDLQGATSYSSCPPPGSCVTIGVVSPTGATQSVRYRVSGSTMYRETDDGTGTFPASRVVSQAIANGSKAAFTCDSGGGPLRVGVVLIVKPSASRDATYRLETAVRPRNTFAAC